MERSFLYKKSDAKMKDRSSSTSFNSDPGEVAESDNNESECESQQCLEEIPEINVEGATLNLADINKNNPPIVIQKGKYSMETNGTNYVIITLFSCKYCTLHFTTEIALQTHEVKHMSLKLPKIFMKKLLPKRFRRAKIMNEQSVIRCISCWQNFPNKKALLRHWKTSQCLFFCAICGKEFVNKPILLKNHVLEVHGINYSVLKQQQKLMEELSNDVNYN